MKINTKVGKRQIKKMLNGASWVCFHYSYVRYEHFSTGSSATINLISCCVLSMLIFFGIAPKHSAFFRVTFIFFQCICYRCSIKVYHTWLVCLLNFTGIFFSTVCFFLANMYTGSDKINILPF